jgi:hypothetical protein
MLYSLLTEDSLCNFKFDFKFAKVAKYLQMREGKILLSEHSENVAKQSAGLSDLCESGSKPSAGLSTSCASICKDIFYLLIQ